MKPPFSLRLQWHLLLLAFIAGGAFEVVDNILGARVLNFESSAPVVVKIAKELAIALVTLRLLWQFGAPRQSRLGGQLLLLTLAIVFLPHLLSPPHTPYAAAGLLYFVGSTVALLATCFARRDGIQFEFSRHFLVPALAVTLITQLLEAWLAPASFYFETNLLDLDRRAGIAAIPTTAGLLGVVGFATGRLWPRALGLLVIAMANSSLSLVCLALTMIVQVRRGAYLILLLPPIVAAAAFLILGREGLEVSIASRVTILEESWNQLAWIGPSSVGALSTAKSVALAPFDSVIVDSFYLETLHVLGIVPGILFLASLFVLIYRRVGLLAMSIFAVAGLGYLVLEAWIVWVSLVFGLPRHHRPRRRRARVRATDTGRPGRNVTTAT